MRLNRSWFEAFLGCLRALLDKWGVGSSLGMMMCMFEMIMSDSEERREYG